jgi:hypothetical protein
MSLRGAVLFFATKQSPYNLGLLRQSAARNDILDIIGNSVMIGKCLPTKNSRTILENLFR